MLERKEKAEKKLIKEARRKAKEDKLIAKLEDKSPDNTEPAKDKKPDKIE